MRKRSNNPLPDYARYTSIALTMAVIITAGVIGGVFMDEWIQTGFPLFTVILSLAAVCLAIYVVVRDLLKSPRKNNEKDL